MPTSARSGVWIGLSCLRRVTFLSSEKSNPPEAPRKMQKDRRQHVSGLFYDFHSTPKCSSKIFSPIRIRIAPPTNSARFSYFAPKALPMNTPASEMTNVVHPMRMTAAPMEIEISTIENDTPTASASILVDGQALLALGLLLVL